MAKYEINLLIDGNLSKEESDTIANNLISSSFKKTKNFKDEYFGHIKLAYKIKKKDYAHFYVYEFETTASDEIYEFRRLCDINKDVLRRLIINIEKKYGYKSTVNDKKIKKLAKAKEIYTKKRENHKAMKEQQNETTTKKPAVVITKKTNSRRKS